MTLPRIIQTEPIRLQCSCCSTPFAEIKNGVLVIISRHMNGHHVNVLKLEDVERLLKEARGDRMPA